MSSGHLGFVIPCEPVAALTLYIPSGCVCSSYHNAIFLSFLHEWDLSHRLSTLKADPSTVLPLMKMVMVSDW